MAFTRAGLDVLYTRGFNPLAKMEIVAPLSVGIAASSEIAAVDFSRAIRPGEFIEKMNAALPDGIRVSRAECFLIPPGEKKHSLSSLLWGFAYAGPSGGAFAGETEYVPATGEKSFREKLLAGGACVFSLRRVCVLARNITANGNAAGNAGKMIGGNIDNTGDVKEQSPAAYFDVYRHLYKT